ncbi:flagellar export chaperone FlgN [Breznakiella homolactica]|uniref:Flagellar export chaperone FlgN n=1 Tax=Breznakiella homolactica TaxID=2798577 RepID=A0A7T7XNZ1_9SPIR|nr:flagellar export chaperone FlgN [Breznakiella homolactica]QQO09727.1 flagellar export chaperone FlgN [Breznakiella homolactica]
MAAALQEKTKQEISPEELVRRVAIVKRFRELLIQQRDRFREYLEVLDKQKDVIEEGKAEDLIAHVELEEKIVADIFSIQKVIDPLEDMYRASYPDRESEVPNLKAALEELKEEAVVRSERNRELLSKRMAEIRSEIKALRGNPYAARRPVYGGSDSASLIDIKG